MGKFALRYCYIASLAYRQHISNYGILLNNASIVLRFGYQVLLQRNHLAAGMAHKFLR